MDGQKAKKTLLLIMDMIVEGRYAELAKLLHEEGITADAIRGVVDVTAGQMEWHDPLLLL